MKTPRALFISLPFILFIGLLAGCEKPQQSLPHTATSALETAYNRTDAEACAEVFTEDGAVLPDNAPILNGKAAIGEYFKENVNRNLTYDTQSTMSAVSGDLAFEQGTYRVRNIEQGRDVEMGKYLNIFKRVNGEWKIYRNIWNTDAAMPAAAVSPAEEEPGEAVE